MKIKIEKISTRPLCKAMGGQRHLAAFVRRKISMSVNLSADFAQVGYVFSPLIDHLLTSIS